MFKTEINKNDIEKAISNMIGEDVRVLEGKNEDGNREIKICKVDKKTKRFTVMIYCRWQVQGDIYKQVVLDLIGGGFKPNDEIR